MTLTGVAVIALLLQSTTASVEGRVFRGNDEPLMGVEVSLLKPASVAMPSNIGNPPPPTGTTDNQGRFRIRDVEPGAYVLNFAKNGYVRQDYGVRSLSTPGAPINFVAGQPLKDIAMRMTPAGAVAGRVLDKNGRPITGIQLQLFRRGYDQNGLKTLQPSAIGQTDDRGEYRLYYVTPGRYYLSALQSSTSGPPSQLTVSSPNETVEPYTPAYYPGVTDASQAAIIDLQPGAELGGMNLTLERQRLYTVRGKLLEDGNIPAVSGVMLLTRTANGFYQPFGTSPRERPRPILDPATRTFEIPNLAPGDYAIVTGNQGTAAGFVRFSIGTADVENLAVPLTPTLSISGRISIEGQPDLSSLPNPERIRVQLRTMLDGAETLITNVFSLPGIPSSLDGKFTIDGVRQMDYRVGVPSMPAGYYLKEARFGPTNVFDQPFRLSQPDPAVLQVVLSPKAGQIRGTVRDDKQQIAAGMQVVLVPDRNRDRPELYKAVTSDVEGVYTIESVPPGDYRLFVWEAAAEPYGWFDPEVIRQLEPRGRRVRIVESARETVELRLTP